MSSYPEARPRSQRITDTLRRLETEIDGWVASADPKSGEPYMVPLSYLWTGETILIATQTDSLMGRNLRTNGRAEFSLAATRDAILIRANVTTLTAETLEPGEAVRFATATGFDPREEPEGYSYFRLTPYRIQAWREVNELAGRTIFKDGTWLA